MNTDYATTIIDSGHATPKGRAVDIRLYIYPDGHGFFTVPGHDPLPVEGPEAAIGLFATLWARTRQAGGAPRHARRTP